MKSLVHTFTSCLLIFCVNFSFAADPGIPSEFQPIVSLLQDKKWDEAATALEKLVTQFPTDSHLLYDLGRVHYEKKDYAKALAYFRRSLQVNPWETSATEGILAAETALDLRALPQDLQLLESLHKFVFQSTPWELFLLLLCIAWVLLLWFFLGWLQKRRNKALTTFSNIFLGGLFFLSFSLSILGYFKYKDLRIQRATVLASRVNALTFPGKDQLIVYSLQQGHEVIVLKQEEDWIFVQYPGRAAGWIPKDAVLLF